jgi:LysR family hca operon transcriptional activator
MLHKHGSADGLRHIRYFVAVAEAGSLTVAAERKLHTSQPSLSRQIRDLENEVGAQLLMRSRDRTDTGGSSLSRSRPLSAIAG